MQISILIDEIARLRTAIQALQESHNVQIQRLEESLEGKRQHILRLENRLGKSDFEDMKKDNRYKKLTHFISVFNTVCRCCEMEKKGFIAVKYKYLYRQFFLFYTCILFFLLNTSKKLVFVKFICVYIVMSSFFNTKKNMMQQYVCEMLKAKNEEK